MNLKRTKVKCNVKITVYDSNNKKTQELKKTITFKEFVSMFQSDAPKEELEYKQLLRIEDNGNKAKFNECVIGWLILNSGLSYEADLKCYENMDIIDLIEGRTDLSWFMDLDKGKTKVVRFLKMLFGK